MTTITVKWNKAQRIKITRDIYLNYENERKLAAVINNLLDDIELSKNVR